MLVDRPGAGRKNLGDLFVTLTLNTLCRTSLSRTVSPICCKSCGAGIGRVGACSSSVKASAFRQASYPLSLPGLMDILATWVASPPIGLLLTLIGDPLLD
jgi:hypothetical protein